MDIYLQGMRDRSMRSGTELVWEIKLTEWSMAGNLSNRSFGVQIPRDICTRLKRYLHFAKCSWKSSMFVAVCLVSKSLLGIERQKKLKKFTILTRKPRSHVGILIY